MKENLYIKNMVCDRCVFSVNRVLDDLEIRYKFISLGEYLVDIKNNAHLYQLKSELKKLGFDLIGDKKKIICSKIKSILIDVISNDILENNSISSILLKNFNYSYNHLSKVFKSSENISIEKYFLKLKIEKIKEYLSYDELSVKEISYKLNYNSVSHLSNHFKKATGFSPSKYKKNKFKRVGLNLND
jgi:AraC family transcriptional regulator